ncbi:MAG TPA: hypothetical protein VLH15_07510 [Dehalococcoidales bacterium]|nr:hypothetical protein [Dehalococcoidales bacterium]
MFESKFEKYVVRKPAVITGVTEKKLIIEVPEGDVIPRMNAVNTGPLILFSSELVNEATARVEYGFITGDTVIGNSSPKEKKLGAHKHEYAEIFLFLGTNPEDPRYLGAEVEFWLGEGEETERMLLTTSSCVYVTPGVGHFPLIYRNVQNAVLMMVIVPDASRHSAIAVQRKIVE